jgi:hypothetical protein
MLRCLAEMLAADEDEALVEACVDQLYQRACCWKACIQTRPGLWQRPWVGPRLSGRNKRRQGLAVEQALFDFVRSGVSGQRWLE